MKRRNRFENIITLSTILITLIPLILSYAIFLPSKIVDTDDRIREILKQTGFFIANSEIVQEKLYIKENDYYIQEYTQKFIKRFKDIDIIVVGDMKGIKYSHLDESQIGQKYVNSDNKQVLETGESYYSIMEGSMGTTLRWFEPIYYNGKQVGFVMVGKYHEDINLLNSKIIFEYRNLFVFAVIIAIMASKIFAQRIKKAILNMEPEEIAILYRQKNIIINSVKDGIIALNKNKEVIEVNNSCYRIFEDFNIEIILNKLKKYIDNEEDLDMKEIIIQHKKIFVTLKHINQGNTYLGVVITITDKEGINKIAKEATGIEEVIKDLRANVHEFKNNLHVILGLMQLNEYEEAKKYILNIKQVQENNVNKFNEIKDNYVRALLLSRELVAKERQIDFELTEESFLNLNHGIIDSYDIVTILGNLIENAFDACSIKEREDKKVEISLYEDEEHIEIQIRDNGIEIEESIKDSIFIEGISSKGKGRGTGLFLVKNKVELYNGRIDIEEFTDEKIFIITILRGE